ncbi:MAG: hypothetical protein LQ352_007073 [Teloschistes flavicans]|nr:MAG: hypothetical protein LQ352_007073 [Teloschistes flavicans]
MSGLNNVKRGDKVTHNRLGHLCDDNNSVVWPMLIGRSGKSRVLIGRSTAICQHILQLAGSTTPLTLPTGSTCASFHTDNSPATIYSLDFMHGSCNGRTRSLTMAQDQLRQHQPAGGPAASAEAVHTINAEGHSTLAPAHKHHALAQPSPPNAAAANNSLLQPPSLTLTTPSSPDSIHHSQPSSSPTESSPTHRKKSIDHLTVQEATPCRPNGLDAQSRREELSSSTAGTQPVLVKQYSKGSRAASSSNQSTNMKQRRQTRSNQVASEMPSLQKFSFQDILASIDPEVSASIDKIAEICGRSKMSLAHEYSSHLPPQGDLPMPLLQDHTDEIPIPRLEPVEEISSAHEGSVSDSHVPRSGATRLSIAGESSRTVEDLLSAAVTATSAAASHVHSSPAQETSRQAGPQSSYLPQLLAWLRNSQDESSQGSRRNPGAANALQRVLGAHSEPTGP